MLLQLAIGDAYGAGFEYADADFNEHHNTLADYIGHPRHNIKPGQYTDDTQMAIAVTEAILSGEEWTPLLLANHFVTAFKRDPREGYASGFYNFLLKVETGQQFLAEIRPDSDKSGAAMRAAPLGVFPTIDEVIQKTTVQAALTHNTSDGINAAVAAALMTHYFLYDRGPKRALSEFIAAHVPGEWTEPWQGQVGTKGWMSVRAALTAITNASSMTRLLKTCIAFSGDVDTVAAIALAAGSCCPEIAPNIPVQLFEHLELSEYGRDYIVALDKRLLALVKK